MKLEQALRREARAFRSPREMLLELMALRQECAEQPGTQRAAAGAPPSGAADVAKAAAAARRMRRRALERAGGGGGGGAAVPPMRRAMDVQMAAAAACQHTPAQPGTSSPIKLVERPAPRTRSHYA